LPRPVTDGISRRHFGAAFAERFLDRLVPTAGYVYGGRGDEARAILDGFGAAYLGTLGGFSRLGVAVGYATTGRGGLRPSPV